ncbi:MAG: hybrid sensor histidine kinase/response regulator [Candidatus Kapaibacteriota bacterium]
MLNNKYEIIVVDDSKMTVEAVCKMIESSKEPEYILYKAYSGMECLRLLGNHNIDLVLMDIVMENFDGFETARVIRANPKYENIPIIFMTANDPDASMKEFAFNHGGIDYLLKPFTEKEINNYLSLYIRFISREREINKKLSDLNLQLHKEVIEKTRAINELKESLEIRHKMFSIISHDLKNPILGYKALVDEYVSNFDSLDIQDFRELLQMLQKSSDNLSNLLNDLLTWANFQRNQISYNPTEFDLSFVATQVIEQANLQAQAKQIGLVNKIPNDTLVLADPSLVSLIFRNLISNAIKFTPQGGFVTLFATEKKDDRKIEVSVSDTGVGIPEDKIQELFKVRTNKTTLGTNKESGTGLGLVIVHEAVAINQGQIKVESKLGKGTTFTFTLPSVEKEIQIEL